MRRVKVQVSVCVCESLRGCFPMYPESSERSAIPAGGCPGRPTGTPMERHRAVSFGNFEKAVRESRSGIISLQEPTQYGVARSLVTAQGYLAGQLKDVQLSLSNLQPPAVLWRLPDDRRTA